MNEAALPWFPSHNFLSGQEIWAGFVGGPSLWLAKGPGAGNQTKLFTYSFSVSAISWIRVARRIPGLVRQCELSNLEALIEAESERQPESTYFVLSCAIPAAIGLFGGGSVFLAWLSGARGAPLAWGAAATTVLAGVSWYVFYKLYSSVPQWRRLTRKLVMTFSNRYCGLANLLGGRPALSDRFAVLMDEAAGLYLKHNSTPADKLGAAPATAAMAIDEAMTRLMQEAIFKDWRAQDHALGWATSLLEEMRSLDATLERYAMVSHTVTSDDPLEGLRSARAELQSITSAVEQLNDETTI